jgi:hypothetical protein
MMTQPEHGRLASRDEQPAIRVIDGSGFVADLDR